MDSYHASQRHLPPMTFKITRLLMMLTLGLVVLPVSAGMLFWHGEEVMADPFTNLTHNYGDGGGDDNGNQSGGDRSNWNNDWADAWLNDHTGSHNSREYAMLETDDQSPADVSATQRVSHDIKPATKTADGNSSRFPGWFKPALLALIVATIISTTVCITMIVMFLASH